MARGISDLSPLTGWTSQQEVEVKEAKDKLPVTLEAPGARIRLARWGSMVATVQQYAKGTDFTPLLKGLQHDRCQAPHWGYMLKGIFHIQYADGHEDVLRAGDLYYLPAGHTGWVEEDVETVEFSPAAEMDETLSHVKKLMGL